MRTFLHCADLHVDSPLRGLERHDGAPLDAIRGATRRALANVVALALSERVAAVFVAGDLFDGAWPDFGTGLFFVREMVRLQAAGIRVFVVRGNHDAESRLVRSLPWPSNVHVFASDTGESVVDESLGLAVHGRSFEQAETRENIALAYPAARSGLFNVGVLHTALTGRAGHEPYAPCRVEDLIARGYDYWALGHVHTREIVSESPWIVFSGNTQSRHVREPGAKGCALLRVDDLHRVRVEWRDVDVARFVRLEIDANELRERDDVLEQIAGAVRSAISGADERLLGVRVVLHGASPAHARLVSDPARLRAEVQAGMLEVAGERAWLEKLVIDTSPPVDRRALRERDDPVGELLRLLDELPHASDAGDLVKAAIGDLAAKLPPDPELQERLGLASISRPEVLRAYLDEVERLLVPLLLESEGTP